VSIFEAILCHKINGTILEDPPLLVPIITLWVKNTNLCWVWAIWTCDISNDALLRVTEISFPIKKSREENSGLLRKVEIQKAESQKAESQMAEEI
jgi:hypothetical protein